MNKPLLGTILGGILGIFDGLSALISEPSVAPEITSIVIGSTFKGLLAGALIGWFARKVDNVGAGIAFGLLVAGSFAAMVAWMDGRGYWWQMMLPGCALGAIVGFATQKYGVRARAA
ncbi:MAG: hypothetical protein IBJ03_02805 [Gemmatimonadaceae bacterium]|nr:hypothetical protein [Gemmatimonadaceae bacterium]